jgi:hypothetical protein
VLATGCRSLLGIDEAVVTFDAPPDTPVSVDAAGDAPLDATDPGIDAQSCFTGFTLVCLAAPPTAPFELDASTIVNTDNDPRCRGATNAAAVGTCVIAGTTVSIASSANLRAIGSRPLILLATTGPMIVDGIVDVASHRGDATRAAGSQLTTCVNGAQPTGQSGGYGGSFGGRGGNGGSSGGTAGQAGPRSTLGDLQGGCPGSAGAGATAGAAGRGGGAVELHADTITIGGVINASGEGGQGGISSGAGGGGGGAGGEIVFSTSSLTIKATGRVIANGGGGGEGSGNGVGGDIGNDPSSSVVTVAASGGSGATSAGGDGGNGGTTANGINGASANLGGGGGGGGGTGVVHSTGAAPVVQGQVSPSIN